MTEEGVGSAERMLEGGENDEAVFDDMMSESESVNDSYLEAYAQTTNDAAPLVPLEVGEVGEGDEYFEDQVPEAAATYTPPKSASSQAGAFADFSSPTFTEEIYSSTPSLVECLEATAQVKKKLHDLLSSIALLRGKLAESQRPFTVSHFSHTITQTIQNVKLLTSLAAIIPSLDCRSTSHMSLQQEVCDQAVRAVPVTTTLLRTLKMILSGKADKRDFEVDLLPFMKVCARLRQSIDSLKWEQVVL